MERRYGTKLSYPVNKMVAQPHESRSPLGNGQSSPYPQPINPSTWPVICEVPFHYHHHQYSRLMPPGRIVRRLHLHKLLNYSSQSLLVNYSLAHTKLLAKVTVRFADWNWRDDPLASLQLITSVVSLFYRVRPWLVPPIIEHALSFPLSPPPPPPTMTLARSSRYLIGFLWCTHFEPRPLDPVPSRDDSNYDRFPFRPSRRCYYAYFTPDSPQRGH